MAVPQPLLLCIRDGKFWGKGKGEGATPAVTQSSAPRRDVFPLENAAGEQRFSLAPTAPPALHFQALSPGTWQAAHRNIRWQRFQHERRELNPSGQERKQREAGAGNGEGQDVEEKGKSVRSAGEGGGMAAPLPRLLPSPALALPLPCDPSGDAPAPPPWILQGAQLTDRRRRIINTTAAVRHQQLAACHTKPCTAVCDIPGQRWEHETRGGREQRAAAQPLGALGPAWR